MAGIPRPHGLGWKNRPFRPEELPAADYLRGDNPVGVALSALMKAPKNERIPFGEEAIRRIGESKLSDGRKALLADCVEAYIDLPPEARAEFHGILERNATGRVPQMHKTRVQIAAEKALAEGIEKERKSNIVRVLAGRLGTVPPELAAKVQAMSDLTALDSLFEAALTAASFDQFRAAVGW